MSLKLTCDGCGAVISGEDLGNGRALEHGGTHYCERCKVPIIAFIQKSMKGGSGLAVPGGGAPAAPGKPSDPLEALEDLELIAEEHRPEPAAPPAPRRPAVPKPGPDPLEALEDLDSLPDVFPLQEPRAKPKGTGAPSIHKSVVHSPAGQRPAVPGIAPGSGGLKKPLAGARPGYSVSPRPAAASGGLRPGSVAPKTSSPIHAPAAGTSNRPVLKKKLPEAEDRLPSPRKKIYLFGGIAAAVVIIAIVLTIALKGGSNPAIPQAPPVESQASLDAKKAVVEKAAALEAQRRDEFQKLRERLTDDADGLLALQADLGRFVPQESLRQDYQALVEDTDKRLAAAAAKLYGDAHKKDEEYQKAENFEAAAALWQTKPEAVRRSELGRKWDEDRERSKRAGLVWALWTSITKQANKYLGQGDSDIAIAILEYEESLPRDCERTFPLIWEKRRARLDGLKTDLARVQIELEKDQRKAREQAEEARKIREEQERAARWAIELEKTPWAPLISQDGDDLENWTVRTLIPNREKLSDSKVAWTMGQESKVPVLSASGFDDAVEIGMNGNRWLGWVLEFDVKVESEALHLKTRTIIFGQVFGARVNDQFSPVVFDFPSDSHGSWKRIRIEARGKKVYLFEGGDKPVKVLDTGHEDGGFIFELDKNGSAKLRDVQLKLVYDKKRPPKEEEVDEE